jgi:pimeloyl-ACP methyl ester carboxylesterase
MARRKKLEMNEHIFPLYMNGLVGRMLMLPAPKNKKREILLLYGHHASIERMYGVAEDLNQYGAVTLPDLPGFGGMQSFYTIDEEPTIDTLADYLAAFVQMRYKHRRFTIMAMSFGFLVATKMLQKYPELAKKVDIVVSIVGFAHHEDFIFKRRNYLLMRATAGLLKHRIPAWLVRHIALRKTTLMLAYRLVENSNPKLRDANPAERRKRINFEVILWQCNDVRTYMFTGLEMLKVNLCDKQVKLPVYHVAVEEDRYFDNRRVEQHLGVIYDRVEMVAATIPGHAPTVVADAKAAAPFVPAKIRRLLKS